MIGSGIFSLPQNMAASAGAGAMLIGWLITGIGMLSLALVYQTLSNRQPALDYGVFAKAPSIRCPPTFGALWRNCASR